jgi:hypothetical protein
VYALEPEVVNEDNENAYMCFFTRRCPEQEEEEEEEEEVEEVDAFLANVEEDEEVEEEGDAEKKKTTKGEEAKQKQTKKKKKKHRVGRNFKIRRQTFTRPELWPSPFAELPEGVQTEILVTGGKDRGITDEGAWARSTLQRMKDKMADSFLENIEEAAEGGEDDGDEQGEASVDSFLQHTTQEEGDAVYTDTEGEQTDTEGELTDTEVSGRPPLPAPWQEVANPNSTWEGDAYYFHNCETDEVTWTRPQAKPICL